MPRRMKGTIVRSRKKPAKPGKPKKYATKKAALKAHGKKLKKMTAKAPGVSLPKRKKKRR